MALLTGLSGVVVLIGPAALAGGSALWAQAACLAAALSYAFAGIYGRRFRRMGIAPAEAAAGQVTASAVLILPIMLVVDRPWTLSAPSLTVWLALGAWRCCRPRSPMCSISASSPPPARPVLLLVTFLIPVPAILLGALVLGERLEPRHFAGMALIGLGLAIIDGRIAGLLRPAK